jgi:hypothetical protein
MGCANTYNHGGSQYATEKLDGSPDLGGAKAVFAGFAHFGLLL